LEPCAVMDIINCLGSEEWGAPRAYSALNLMETCVDLCSTRCRHKTKLDLQTTCLAHPQAIRKRGRACHAHTKRCITTIDSTARMTMSVNCDGLQSSGLCASQLQERRSLVAH
jgi:hypothetical protein